LLHFAECNATAADHENGATDQIEIHWKLHGN
jgi:hypothetical protein